MILPQGFSQAGSNYLMPKVEKLIEIITKENYFKIIDTMYYRYSLNYNLIFIEDSSKKILKERFIKILIHANFPYIAFAKATKRDESINLDYYNHEFIDEPFLIKSFKNCEKYLKNSNELKFKILSEYILEYTLNFSDKNVKFMLQNLSKQEWDDIKYWNPHKVGDIIFNMWD